MEPNELTLPRHTMSVRVELVLTTSPGEGHPDEREVVMFAETSLDPAVGFVDALDRASARLVTAMAGEAVLGIRLRRQVDVMADKLEAAGA